MSYVISEILGCLLIAGLIGAILGWLFRGGCSDVETTNPKGGGDDFEPYDYRKDQKISDDVKLKHEKESAQNESIKDEIKGEIDSTVQKATSLGAAEETTTKAFGEESIENLNESKESLINTVKKKADAVEGKVKESTKNISPSAKEVTEKGTSTASELAQKATAAGAGIVAGAKALGEEEKEKIEKSVEEEEKRLPTDRLALFKELGIDTNKMKFLEDNYDIQAIEGIGPKYAKLFKEMGITTTNDLLEKIGKDRVKIDDAAKKLKVQPDAIIAWISMAELIKLPGANGQAAEILNTVGVGSLAELAITNPDTLHKEMSEFNKKSSIVPEVPSLDLVRIWTKVAKKLT